MQARHLLRLICASAWVIWQELIDLFELLGLVYVRPHAPRRFYPTHLVLDLCSQGASANPGLIKSPSAPSSGVSASHKTMDGQVEEGRCIIIETNYKMYAYTTSVLQEQVLRLFTEIDYKLPHMLIGVITRKSIRRALTTGITATQIIDYLYMHAHPQVSHVWSLVWCCSCGHVSGVAPAAGPAVRWCAASCSGSQTEGGFQRITCALSTQHVSDAVYQLNSTCV